MQTQTIALIVPRSFREKILQQKSMKRLYLLQNLERNDLLNNTEKPDVATKFHPTVRQ